MIHIMFGESAEGSMRFAFKKDKSEIIAFPNFLGEGPIQGLLTTAGLNARAAWLERAFRIDGLDWTSRFEQAIKQLEAVAEGESVLIWASENAVEQFGLRLACHVLRSKKCSIYFCNTYENMLFMHPEHNTQMEIRHTGEINARQMRIMLHEKQFELLSTQQIAQLVKQAEQLMQGDSLLRTWQRGEILEDVETRDDALILHYLKELQQEMNEEFIRAPRLIGHVLGYSEHDIHDMWIEYRLLTFIKQGAVNYRGDLRGMRMYEVQC